MDAQNPKQTKTPNHPGTYAKYNEVGRYKEILKFVAETSINLRKIW